MSLPPLVEIPFYDPAQDSGTARLLGLEPDGRVKVQFVIGRGRPRVLPVSLLRKEDAALVTQCRNEILKKEAAVQETESSSKHNGESASAGGSSSISVRSNNFEFPRPRSLATWSRLLSFGDACASRKCFSETGFKALWALILPWKAEVWLASLSSKVNYTAMMTTFCRLWWKYCCATAHTTGEDLDKRSKLLVLELVCAELCKAKSKHGCVFSALLMQVGLLPFHDQSVCYVGANLDDVGYNHKVDCGKVGPLVKASALLRHETRSQAARRALETLRNPRSKAVWLLQKKSKNFMRMRKYMLKKFLPDGGVVTRMLPGTTTISYWSDEEEAYVQADDFHTTLDAVAFKRCGDEIVAGDIWLQQGLEEWRVKEIQQCYQGNADCVSVTVKRGSVVKTEVCAATRVLPVGRKRAVREVEEFLLHHPDVVDTMCLSTGHPAVHMKKTRKRLAVSNMVCREKPIECSWQEYVLWRCATSLAVSSFEERRFRVASAHAKNARYNWLCGNDLDV